MSALTKIKIEEEADGTWRFFLRIGGDSAEYQGNPGSLHEAFVQIAHEYTRNTIKCSGTLAK